MKEIMSVTTHIYRRISFSSSTAKRFEWLFTLCVALSTHPCMRHAAICSLHEKALKKF